MSVRKDKVQIEVEINGNKASKVFKDLDKEAREVTKKMSGLKKAFDKVGESERNLKNVTIRLKEMEGLGKTNTNEYKKLVREQARLNKVIQAGQEDVKKYREEFPKLQKKLGEINRDILEAGKKQGVAFDQLISRQKFLQREIRRATDPKHIQRLQEELDELNPRISEMSKRFKGVSKTMNNVKVQSGGVVGTFSKFLPALGVAAIVAGVGRILRGIADLGKESLKLFNIQAKADAQLKATLSSTNEVAGRSFEQLKQQAAELQKITLFGDEETQQAQALLLTFTNVRTEVFDRSVPAIQDYATALATASGESVDLKSASIQVGKALNDPVKGVSALSKAGVQFSDEQKIMIKSLVDTGKTAEAQAIILTELETQFKGSAKAAAEAGLGPYTQLKNRLADVKEQFGELIERGLKRLNPFLLAGVEFVEGFVGAVLSGEKATGKFSTGINATIFVLKALILPIKILWNTLYSLYNNVFIPFSNFLQNSVLPRINSMTGGFNNLIEKAKKLPIIGTIIKGLVAYIKLFGDMVSNTSATFSGLQAAAKQAVQNIGIFFSNLIKSAQIAAKQLQLALTIDGSTRKKLKEEIQQLKDLKEEAKKSGLTIGEAYAKARNAAIEVERKAQVEADKKQATEDAKRVAEQEKALQVKKAASQKAIAEGAKKQSADLLKERLAEMKVGFEREQLLLENKRIEGEINEKTFHQKLHESTIEFYKNQLEAFKQYGKESSNEALKIQNDLLKLQQAEGSRNVSVPQSLPGTTIQPVQSQGDSEASIEDDTNRELLILENKFQRLLLAEQDYELARLEVMENAAERRLELARIQGEQDVSALTALENQKLDIQREKEDLRTEYAQQSANMRKQVEQHGYNAAKGFLQLGIQMLGQDEKARKKHGRAIKAIKIALVGINLFQELSNINTRFSELPPIVGQALGAVYSAFAVARSVLAIRNIAATKFYRGGKVKSFTGEKVKSAANFPTQQGGDNILALLKDGEVVLNKEQQKALGGDTAFAKIGVPGFATGGVVSANLTSLDTTPRGQFVSDLNLSQPTSAPTNDLSELNKKISLVLDVFAAFPGTLKANVVYEDFVEKETEIQESETAASI